MAFMRCAGMTLSGRDISDDVDYIEPPTKNQFVDMCNYLHMLMKEYHLTDFDARISPHHCEPGYVAEVETDFRYRKVVIALCPQFYTFDPPRQRTILCHEIGHVHCTCLKMPYEGIKEVVSADVWTVVDTNAMAVEEHMVTALEWSTAHRMPLPNAARRLKK